MAHEAEEECQSGAAAFFPAGHTGVQIHGYLLPHIFPEHLIEILMDAFNIVNQETLIFVLLPVDFRFTCSESVKRSLRAFLIFTPGEEGCLVAVLPAEP